ncbi:polyketide synthase [Amycolatopsis sp. NPDC021455]|uniref:polyketide synthase n=1 Tax=Amycolatopsis sp. NPDC021455 TaxID=3154901 RepID=UPI00340D0EB7
MSPVAVVGIACRFPGADGKDAFWDLLTRRGDGVAGVPAARWPARGFYADDGRPGTINNVTGGFLSDVDVFDHEFFAMSEAEAAAMDPQQRMLLQCSWHAFEDAGVDPRSLASSATGVYVGVTANDWLWKTAAAAAPGDLAPAHGAGSGHNMAANRISYQYNLRGPSVAVDTACSSSLVAIHLAASALRLGECDHALAGGANAVLEPINGIYFTMLGLSAPDGRCKPFAAGADGMGRGEGVGLVVLRRLEDALADGQRVYAVLEGSAVTHGGRGNGITAPAGRGQRDVIEFAHRQAGITATDVDFVEAHGTGTLLGDLIEAKALGDVHGVPRERPCVLGSVKGNIGHTEGAAGVAGLIKAALALYHGTLPATIGGLPENPELKLAERGLRLAHEPTALPETGARGGVSAFGLGGTNAHVVLASAPRTDPAADGGLGVFTLSAVTTEALRRNMLRQARHIEAGDAPLAELCAASNRVKGGLRRRFACAPDSRDDLLAALRAEPGPDRPARPRMALVFGETADVDPEFLRSPLFAVLRAEFDELAGAPLADTVLRHPRPAAAPEFTFVAQYLLGRAVLALGVRPVALAGGLAAAHFAGARDLPESLRLAFAETAVPSTVAGTPDRLTHVVGVGAPAGPGTFDAPPSGEALTLASADALRRLAVAAFRHGCDPRWDVFGGGPARPVLAPYAFSAHRFPLSFSAREDHQPRAHAALRRQ